MSAARGSRGPRIRTIKPDAHQDEAVGAVSRDARLLFFGLITQADDDGRQKAALPLLRSLIYPYDVDLDPALIGGWLDELAMVGLVVRYEHDDRSYLWLPGFQDNQKIDKPTPSRLPSPPNFPVSTGDPANLAECSANSREDSRKVALEGKGEEGRGEELPPCAPTREPGGGSGSIPEHFDEVMGILTEAARTCPELLVVDAAVLSALNAYPERLGYDHRQAAHAVASHAAMPGLRTPRANTLLLAELRKQTPVGRGALDSRPPMRRNGAARGAAQPGDADLYDRTRRELAKRAADGLIPDDPGGTF